MMKCKYNFSPQGVKHMYNDALEMIFTTLQGESKDYTIEELDINITIGDKEITVPLNADIFEELFQLLEKEAAR